MNLHGKYAACAMALLLTTLQAGCHDRAPRTTRIGNKLQLVVVGSEAAFIMRDNNTTLVPPPFLGTNNDGTYIKKWALSGNDYVIGIIAERSGGPTTWYFELDIGKERVLLWNQLRDAGAQTQSRFLHATLEDVEDLE